MAMLGLIMVVDDDSLTRELVCVVLRGAGYEVIAAENGSDAILLFRCSERKPNLLISDVVMPGITGPELMEILVGTGAIARGLLISANPGEARLHLLERRIGVRIPLLRKPFSVARLLTEVEELLPPASLEQATG